MFEKLIISFMKKGIFILIIGFIVLTSSCSLFDRPEQIPAYIHIDSFVLQGNYDTSGSLSKTISDVWIIIDDELIGCFELPATVPLLKSGNHKLYLKAGVKENGIANTRIPYPFYQYFVANHQFVADKIDTFNPEISYLTTKTKMVFNEDFEGGNILFDPANINNAVLERTSNKVEVFEGKYSYKASLPVKDDIFALDGEEIYDLPRNKSVFIEMNFKTDVILTIGYKAIGPSSTVSHNLINLNPTKKWKKIYINFGSELLYIGKENYIQFVIGAVNTNTDTAKIYLDNIKLFSFY